jgi:hypothetical protein
MRHKFPLVLIVVSFLNLGDGVVPRDEVAKMIAAGRSLAQIEKEFKVPQEFAHYTGPERLRSFYKLFYNQLMETGY